MNFLKLSFLFGVSSLLVAQQTFADPLEVKVGILLSRTGTMADIGQQAEHGYSLAIKDLKSKLESKNYKVTFIYEDSRSTPESSATATNKLIKSDRVAIILGDSTSTDTLAAAPVAQAAGIPLLSPSSTSDKVTLVGDHISRSCFIDSFQGIAMANYAFDSLKAKNAVILVDSDMDHSRDVSKVFEKQFKEKGGTIQQVISFSGTHDSALLSQLMQIRKLKPDVVYAPVYYSVMASIFKQSSALQIKTQYLGTDAWDSPQLFELANKTTEGGLMTNPFSYEDPSAKVQKFRNDFKESYKAEPSSYAALAYDTIFVLENALERLKWPVAQDKLSEDLNKAIVSTKNVAGVTGDITLDKNRNVQKPNVVILKLTNSGYKFHAVVHSK